MIYEILIELTSMDKYCFYVRVKRNLNMYFIICAFHSLYTSKPEDANKGRLQIATF